MFNELQRTSPETKKIIKEIEIEAIEIYESIRFCLNEADIDQDKIKSDFKMLKEYWNNFKDFSPSLRDKYDKIKNKLQEEVN